jgi:hypothetical protein
VKAFPELLAALLVTACGASTDRGAEPPFATVYMPAPSATVPPGAPPAASSEPAGTVDSGCERDESPEAAERAKVEYQRGLVAVRAKRYRESLEAFRSAYVRMCSHTLLFLIGVSQEGLGELEAARATLREYARIEHSDIGQRRVESYLACIDRRMAGEKLDCLDEERAKPP